MRMPSRRAKGNKGVIDEFSDDHDNDTIFESFSDISLFTLAVAFVQVTQLALNNKQKFYLQKKPTKFIGGLRKRNFFPTNMPT